MRDCLYDFEFPDHNGTRQKCEGNAQSLLLGHRAKHETMFLLRLAVLRLCLLFRMLVTLFELQQVAFRPSKLPGRVAFSHWEPVGRYMPV